MAPLTKKAAKPNLTDRVTSLIRQQISNGIFQVGDRLPKEAALCTAHSVSRTVVREALARLKADGLVEARHGVGFFVTDPGPEAGSERFMAGSFDHISSIIEALELRRGVEIEAAGLAAERRSPAQEARIREAFLNLKAALEDDTEDASEADLELHRAIAEATNNQFFPEFLDLVIERAITRAMLTGHGGKEARRLNQTQDLLAEHRHIAEAISDGDSEKARKAMRVHLEKSELRFRASARDDL